MTRNRDRLIDKKIGSVIRMQRVKLRMSQSDLGNFLGVTFQQIQKYENGGRSDHPPPDEVLRQPKIVLRIGINLGDVIIEGADIYGAAPKGHYSRHRSRCQIRRWCHRRSA
jgi:transcriptional regulator with XRE-family HTH domain